MVKKLMPTAPMNFPPKTYYRRKSPISPQVAPQLRLKMTRLVSRHDEVKIAYQRLKSQITVGLLQAEEVFASLAVPLMKLVGLKTVEMAEEGRFSTIVIDTDSPHQRCGRNGAVSVSPSTSRPSIAGEDQSRKLEVEIYATKATKVGKELVEKQQTRLIQLVHLLRQIETEVNMRRNNMSQSLTKHHASLHKIFQKAVQLLSHFQDQNDDTFLVTVKLLKGIFDHVGSVFESMENGLEELMQDLAQQMCDPMVKYVRGIRDDMKMGSYARLLATLEEMQAAVEDGKIELEEARKRIREAEEGKIAALRKLKETEEKIRRMKENVRLHPEARRGTTQQVRFLAVAKRGPKEPSASQKLPSIVEDEEPDDILLWELLKRKRKYKTPESPMGPKQLLYSEPSYHKPSKEVSPSFGNRTLTLGFSRRLQGPQSPISDTRIIPLGQSPSTTTRKAVPQKRFSARCPGDFCAS